MRNAIPIGFIALVGFLYMAKDKKTSPITPAVKRSSTTGKTAPRAPRKRKWNLSSKRPKQKFGNAKGNKMNRTALMKKIRAMLAKRRQRSQLRKKLAAMTASKKPSKRPAVSTPPTSPLKSALKTPKVPAGLPSKNGKIDRTALMKKIRAMLAKRRQQNLLKKRAAATTVSGKSTASATGGNIVELQTSKGNIRVQLFNSKAPITVANFLKYVRSGHYNNTIFHRVIPNFMIQGGGMDAKMQKKATSGQIKNEADNGLKNEIGTLAMARTGAPHSASAQFFINTKNNRFLNHRSKATSRTWGYAVFGKVIQGMDVVSKISATPTTTKSRRSNVPVTPILIIKAVVIK